MSKPKVTVFPSGIDASGSELAVSVAGYDMLHREKQNDNHESSWALHEQTLRGCRPPPRHRCRREAALTPREKYTASSARLEMAATGKSIFTGRRFSAEFLE
jgi:hypothetical protein